MPARKKPKDGLEQKVESRHSRDPGNPAELIKELEEKRQALQSSNEELKIAEEELRTQADELVASRIELQRAIERYRDLFHEAPDGYVVTNAAGLIMEINKAAARLLGHTVESLTATGRYLLPNFIPSIAHRIKVRAFSVLSIKEIPESPLHAKVVPLRGKPFWAAITVSASSDKAGRVTSLRWLIRDVTEQRQAQEELRESEEKFSRAFSSNPAAMMLSRLEDGRILDVNRTWLNLFGYGREEVVGRYAQLMIWPKADSVRSYMRELTEKGFLQGWELEFRKKSRDLFVAQLSAQVLKIGSRNVALSTLVDISDRKKAEQQLRELNDSLERRVVERTLEAEKRALQLRQLAAELTLSEQRERQRLAMILHDGLQQTLVAAKFSLALLERGGDVRAGAYEISGLIDDCIATSRSLTVELSPPILYTGGLVPALEWLSKSMQEKHGLTVKLTSKDPVDKLPQEIKVLLFESTRELLFNVVKHAGVRTAEVDVRIDSGRIEIDVVDAGVGFDVNQLSAKNGDSRGMGLFSIKERLSYFGGTMEMKSSPGDGSRFRIIAPSAFDPERIPETLSASNVSVAIAPETEPEQLSHGRRIRVVLIDDHVVMRQGLASLLRSEPDMLIVGEASDGESGLKVVRDTHPNVVLMDISMPGTDGIQATKLIHKEMPEVKIIGLSMFQESAQAAAIREAGAIKYMTKSGPADALVDAIRKCG